MSDYLITDEYIKHRSARSIPGAWFDPATKSWYLTNPTARACAVALKLFPQMGTAYPDMVTKRDSLNQDARPLNKATELGIRASDCIDTPGGLTYYDYQDLDIGYVMAILEERGGAYIGWERGLGKTLAACSIIEASGAQRSLVIAPNTAKRSVWEPELRRFLPNHEVVILPNEKAKREKMLDHVLHRQQGKPLVLVVHYEALHLIGKTAAKNRGWDRFGTWDVIVADEAHRLKNGQAQMVKALKRIPSRYRIALSGSIIENHAEELFSPLQWLFPKKYRSKWRDWNDKYLDYIEGPFGKICVGVKPLELESMRAELGEFMVYRRKEDELDLPKRTEQTLLVDLSPTQRRVYEELRDTCISQLDSGEFVAAEDGLPLLGKLRQVATGLDLVDEGVSDSSKIDLAVELIEDNPDAAFVVFSWYKSAAHALSDRLSQKNIDHFKVTGDVKHDDRADFIHRFQDGERRVFIGTVSTLGESVDLYRATNVIFLDRSWNPGANDQAADRVYRIGQTLPVTVSHIVARDTVDELNVQPALQSKEALRNAILGGKGNADS